MACDLTIDFSSLIAATDEYSDVVRVDVSGTAVDCSSVKVELSNSSAIATVVVPVVNGAWLAEFIDSQGGVSLKEFACGDKVKIVAICTEGKCEGSKAQQEGPLPCEPRKPVCPDISIVTSVGNCQSGQSDTRPVTFMVTVAGGQTITYRWFFGDGTPQTASQNGSGTFQTQHDYAAGETYSATLIVIDPPGCLAQPDPVTVEVPSCGGCPDDPQLGIYRRRSGNRFEPVAPDAECFEPGSYEIRVENAMPSGTTVFWEINDEPSGQGNSIEVLLDEGEAIEISVTVFKDGCPPRSETIFISSCVDCPTEAELLVEQLLPDGTRQRVDAARGCLPEGRYVVRLLAPGGYVDIDWFVDEEFQAGNSSETLNVTLGEGDNHRVAVVVTYPACPPLNPSIDLEACRCVDNIGLVIRDQSGAVVDVSQCVAPGTYSATATGEGIGGEGTDLSWQINGNPVPGNGTEQPVTIAAPVIGVCGRSAPATTVSVTARRNECNPATASATLNVCARFVLSVCCEIMDMVLIVFAGLTAIALALAICPQALVIPPVVAFFVAFGWPIFFALLAVLLVTSIVWIVLCPPDWCFDIMPILWQFAMITGVVLIYFGSCPACFVTPIGPLLLWGVGVLIIGASILLVWILTCQPSQCQVIWELLKLGIASTVVGLIESIISLLPLIVGLTSCVSIGAVIYLWLFNLALDALLMLLPAACGFNPRGAAVARRLGRARG